MAKKKPQPKHKTVLYRMVQDILTLQRLIGDHSRRIAELEHHGASGSAALKKLDQILAQMEQLMATVQEVKDQADKALAAIRAESDKDDAIIALVTANTAQITALKQQLADALAGGADPAALQAVLDSLTAAESAALSNAQKVVDAVNANTPTDPPSASAKRR